MMTVVAALMLARRSTLVTEMTSSSTTTAPKPSARRVPTLRLPNMGIPWFWREGEAMREGCSGGGRFRGGLDEAGDLVDRQRAVHVEAQHAPGAQLAAALDEVAAHARAEGRRRLDVGAGDVEHLVARIDEQAHHLALLG